ncbi:TSCPD domain-containing protein [Hungatella hathewayi]
MFRGLSCAERPTSCPDQMAQALEQYLTGAAQPQ